MKYGCAHVLGLYNVPDDGNQFQNGCDAIAALGVATLKVYLTKDYLLNYPLQTSWSGTPTNLTELAQTTQFTTQLNAGWDTIIFTAFTFANGTTNWWRTGPTNAQLAAEYTEIYNLAVHLLTTYNDSGKTFILQNWEGDWAFMDSFTPTTFVERKMVDYYVAFVARRQKAVSDARQAVAYSNVTVLNAVEVNRVLDAKTYPHRRRIITDLAGRIRPDIVSFSAYEATDSLEGWGSQAAFDALCESNLTQAVTLIRNAFPDSKLMIGEFGYPENQIVAEFPSLNVGSMIQTVATVASNLGVDYLIYWQVFDNETSIPYTYRGYWFRKPDNTLTLAGSKFQDLCGGGF